MGVVTEYWLNSNDERVQLVLHDLGTGKTTEIWYSPIEVKYEPSSAEKFVQGANTVKNAAENFGSFVSSIPSQLDGLQSSMMGNTYGEMEGERGLLKTTKVMNEVGDGLLLTPLAPAGLYINVAASTFETVLDFSKSTVSTEDAIKNAAVRAISIIGTYKVSKLIPDKTVGKKVVDYTLEKSADEVSSKIISPSNESSKEK